MASYLDDRGRRILGALDEVSARLGASPAQVALAWLMARPGLTAPIASATSREQLASLMHAVEVRLEREDVELLEGASGGEGGER